MRPYPRVKCTIYTQTDGPTSPPSTSPGTVLESCPFITPSMPQVLQFLQQPGTVSTVGIVNNSKVLWVQQPGTVARVGAIGLVFKIGCFVLLTFGRLNIQLKRVTINLNRFRRSSSNLLRKKKSGSWFFDYETSAQRPHNVGTHLMGTPHNIQATSAHNEHLAHCWRAQRPHNVHATSTQRWHNVRAQSANRLATSRHFLLRCSPETRLCPKNVPI